MKTVDELLEDARKLLPERPSPQQTLREIAEGALVVDIRGDEQQRRDGLIPGATIIRRNVLEWRCDPKSEWRHSKVMDHGQRIILVCDEGYQSSLAAANLHLLGMRNATDMAGGFQQWKSAGLAIAPYGARMKLGAALSAWIRKFVPSILKEAVLKHRRRKGAA
jgi:rhodanese-related sulfurtransferase